MNIENNILQRYLKNVYFIAGTASAEKSAAAKMLSERYGLILFGEDHLSRLTDDLKDIVVYSPESHEFRRHISELRDAGAEAAELISLSRDRKVIADTNIPLDILHEISDHAHVAVILSRQCMDAEKYYNDYSESGFFTLIHENCDTDTNDTVCDKLAEHFGLKQEQADRIAHYESLMQRVIHMNDGNDKQKLLCDLSDYYSSPEWKLDFAADESGRLPKELKRGVLSEDGLYNLLENFKR